MVRIVAPIISILILLSLSACTYHGNLGNKSLVDSQFGKKIPLKIALLENISLKKKPFIASGGGHGVEIFFSGSLLQTLYVALGSKFEQVRIITNKNDVKTGEYIVSYDLIYKPISSDSWSGRYVYDAVLKVFFIHPSDNTILAKFERGERIVYTPSGASTAASVVQGLSLFLLTPITAPIQTEAIGSRAVDLIKNAIRESTLAVVQEIDLDRRIATLANFGKILPSAKVNSATDKKVKTLPPSVYDDFLNAVVVVRNSTGLGSGFFVSSGGMIVTNAHVIASDSEVAITVRYGPVVIGRVIHKNMSSDIAIISAPYTPRCFLQLAGADDGGIGSEVLAIGSPEGLFWSVSKGIVSAYRYESDVKLIQTDAAINKGNSGGPLILLSNGKVLGVNALSLNKSQTEGLNFAVSSIEVKKAMASIK